MSAQRNTTVSIQRNQSFVSTSGIVWNAYRDIYLPHCSESRRDIWLQTVAVALPISRRFLADSATFAASSRLLITRSTCRCSVCFAKSFAARRVSSVYRSVSRLITRYAFRESAFHSRPIVILTRDPNGRTLVFYVYTRARLFSDVFQRRGDVISNSRSWLICIGNYVLLQWMSQSFSHQFFLKNFPSKFLSYPKSGMTNFHGDIQLLTCAILYSYSINLYPAACRSIFSEKFLFNASYNSKIGILANFYGDIQLLMYGY